MKRYPVLIVDPNPRHRWPLHQRLRLSFQVIAVSSVEEALACFDQFPFQAIIAALRQDSGHGLELCQKLRQRAAARDCLMVVHGRIRGNPSREAIQEKWGVDVLYPFHAEPDLLESLLWDQLHLKRREQEFPACSPSPRLEPLDRRLGRLVTLLFKEFNLLPPPRPLAPSQLTVLELLNSRPTRTTLRALLHRLRAPYPTPIR